MTLDATTEAEPTDSPTPYPGLTRRVTVPLFALAAGAGGFLVAACGSSSDSATANTSASTDSDGGADETPSGAAPTSASADDSKELTSLSKVPVGGGLILTDKKIVLTRDSGGTVHAFSAVCTHQGCTVSSVKNGVIMCPCHGSRYDATTGKNIGGPAPSPLASVAVTVRGDGVYKA
jgi:Rieske Fe-S protein